MQKHAGKLIIIAVFLIGFGSAGVSIWYRYTQTRQVLEYYGGPSAEAITSREAKATLYLLGKSAEQSDKTLELHFGKESSSRAVEAKKDVTKAPGFFNARNAMTLDRSYDWDDTKPPGELTWRYALEIADEDRTTTITFSTECEYLMLAGPDGEPAPEVPAAQRAVRAAAMSHGIQKLFSEQFEED